MNLCISKYLTVQFIRNSVGTIDKIVFFSLENWKFIITKFTVVNILCVTLPISKCLQGTEEDFICESNCVTSISI